MHELKSSSVRFARDILTGIRLYTTSSKKFFHWRIVPQGSTLKEVTEQYKLTHSSLSQLSGYSLS